MIKKLSIILILIVYCLFTLTGCYSAAGLETLAYVVALGIDKGENDKIKLSLQFAVLSQSNSEGSRKQSITGFYYINS